MDGAALISTAGWTYILKGDTESERHDHPCACFSASDWLSAKSNFQGTRPRIAITRHAFKGRTSIGTNKEARRGCSSASGFASWGALTYVRRRPSAQRSFAHCQHARSQYVPPHRDSAEGPPGTHTSPILSQKTAPTEHCRHWLEIHPCPAVMAATDIRKSA